MNTFADGERRWTAVLFADMANFSSVTEAVGPEKVYQLVSRVFDIAISSVEAHGGKPLNFGGDSLLASFGAPVALEDASAQACRAAWAFLQSLQDELDVMEQKFGVRPAFRVGISGGHVVIGRLGMSDKMDLNIMGAPVNEASRLEALAMPGQILISGAVAEQAEGWIETGDLGLQMLKGFAAPTQVYELLGVRQHAARFEAMERRGLVPMVGREEKLDRLHQIFGVLPDGLALASISGPAGIGKSRLMHAFQTTYKSARILLGQCNPASEKIPFKPFAEILRAAAQVSPEAKGADVVAALGRRLDNPAIAQKVAPLFEVVGPSGAANEDSAENLSATLELRNGILEVLRLVFTFEPTLIVIEDAHWLDDLSSDLVDVLADPAPSDMRVAIILTHRPEYAPRWLDQPYCAKIVLRPLSAELTSKLVARHLKVPSISERLSQLLFDKAEGIPLFAEEILRFLISSKALEETSDGFDLKPGEVPEVMAGNLQQLVLRRVDALPPDARQSLSVLSALGRQISEPMLARLVADDKADGFLALVTEASLLERDPTSGRTDWRFSHALLRDAIYGSLLAEQRKMVHGLIAEAYEDLQQHVNSDLTASLAYHYTQADLPRKAVGYLVKAAQTNSRVYAFRTMYGYLQTAYDFARADPDVISDAEYNQMVVLWLSGLNDQGDFRTLVRVADETLPRMQKSGAQSEHDRALSAVAMALAHTRDYDRGIALMRPTIERASARNDKAVEGWCKAALIRLLDESQSAPAEEIVALARNVLEIAAQLGDHRLEMAGKYLLCAHYRGEGDVSRAFEIAAQLRQFAETYGDLRARAYANWSEAIVFQTSDEVEKSFELAMAGRNFAVTDSADRLVHSAIACGASVLGPEPELLKDELADSIAEARLHNDFNLVHPLAMSSALMQIRMRRLKQGWADFNENLRDVASVGNITYLRFFLLARAEVVLTIAGLLKPAVLIEGEPDRTVRKPDKMRLGDYLTALRIKFGARRSARDDLDLVLEYMPNHSGVLYARVLICEAVLCRKAADRAEKLDQAMAIAKQHDLRQFIRRVEANRC